MNPETEFDAYLSHRLQAAPLPDAGFTPALSARMGRHRRRCHFAWLAAVGVAAVVITLVLRLLPALLPHAPLTPEHIVAWLLMATLCGLAWLGAESWVPKARRLQIG